MDLTGDDLAVYLSVSESIIGAFGRLHELSETEPPVKYPRDRGHHPGPEGIRPTPGTGNVQSKASPQASLQARGSHSRTTNAWPEFL
jgi:hypothetical protein